MLGLLNRKNKKKALENSNPRTTNRDMKSQISKSKLKPKTKNRFDANRKRKSLRKREREPELVIQVTFTHSILSKA